MKLCDVFSRILAYSNRERDVLSLLQTVVKNKEKLHICDLDMSLILLAFGEVSLMKESEIAALADSEYAKLIAPEFFDGDMPDFDGQEFMDKIVKGLTEKLADYTLSPEEKRSVLEHSLSNEVDFDSVLSDKPEEITLNKNIGLKVRCNEFYSFALSQTRFSVINEVVISNSGSEAVKNAKLKISATPDYIEISDIDISVLNPAEPVSICKFDVTPRIERLLELSEKVIGKLNFRLEKDDEILAEFTSEIEFLSYDTWFGNVMPETAALFVTPNDEAVKNIIRLTAKKLQEQTSSPSLSDYQTNNKNDVAAQLKALYDVLHDRGIGYVTPPASYETAGQKLRLPHDVLTGKQGTCLDLAVLFASCAEAMGLNSFIVRVSEHAYAGVFLSDEHFPLSVYEDAGNVLTMNSEAENELILIETTMFTAGKAATFEQACATGRLITQQHITDGIFQAIDIGLCRSLGYLPLPIKFDDVEKIAVDYDVIKQNEIRLAAKDYSYIKGKLELENADIGKFDIWEKKLLDLSKRNQLIDYKLRGKGLQILSYDMNALYQAFEKKGRSYTIAQSDLNLSLYELLELPAATEENYKMVSDAFKGGTLSVVKRNSPINASLKFFYRERRRAFEESGSNVLYLALGFISWFESDKAQMPRFSPIVLVPVDLKRHSKESYSLVGREDAPFLNISIFEYFHQEFKMNFDDLLSMPLFDGEADVDKILNTVAEKVKNIKRATVIRTAALNVFNFSKAVMWRDIKYRREDLAKHKVIQSIIDGRYILEESERLTDEFDDDRSNPKDLAIPLSADSSQISAIKDCADGKSFILQGPPGTGKSQTITNMIVNAIYHGKSVLFVAEKMAALEVVQKRLKKLSLDMFALEAHSVKSDKASIMEQFERRISLGVITDNTEEFEKISEELKAERVELNRVINLLHRKNDYFISFYDAFVNYLRIADDVKALEVPDNYLESLDGESFEKAECLLNRLSDSLLEANGIKDNPFVLYGESNYIPGISKSRLLKQSALYRAAITEFLQEYKRFTQANELDADLSRERASALCGALKKDTLMSAIPAVVGTTLCEDNRFLSLLAEGIEYQDIAESLADKYNDSVFDYDFKTDENAYKGSRKAFFIAKAIKTRKLIANARQYAKVPKYVKEADLPDLYHKLTQLKDKEKSLLQLCERYKFVFNKNVLSELDGQSIRRFNFREADKRIKDAFELQTEYAKVLGVNELRAIIQKTQEYSLMNRDELITAYEKLKELEEAFEKEFKFDYSLCGKYGIDYGNLVDLLDLWCNNIDRLSVWCAYLSVRNECMENGLGFVIEAADKLTLSDISRLADIYCKSVYEYILAKLIVGDDSGSFNSVELRQHMETYKNLIDRFSLNIIKETAAKVSAHTPLINDKSPISSEQGKLNRAVKNKCRGKSVRHLFEETQHILTKLFPVFLMSPISCAQYLSPDMPKFDIVIFDEASQMPTSEAVGAISRGNSLIVVGDSKQMPPTAFFKSKGSDEEYVDLGDQQSILDDCDVIGMPSRSLLWHYRSRHESLIRFSNAKFYQNKLTTFPSPNDMISKVSFRKVDGVYGGTKATNEKEAKAIVAEIGRRLSSPELRKKSIGVVTFSSVQQEVVEDLLQDFFAEHKDLELINAENPEPIIVKNLENIQGDERDVILFSVCYGPDKEGKMYYRFGPINNAGGEKRLNVAVSRARYEMIVFASFEPELLSAMKTDSRGAQDLYSFLRYAKYGADSLAIENINAAEFNVGIEAHIAEGLRQRGYNVKTNVGKSSFRVDVGVVDSQNENRYLLGIVCDSYSYENASTSRDRNVVQPSVLKGLGWNIMRIWSFDYYDNPNKVIDEIVKNIEDIKANPDAYAADEDKSEPIDIRFETKEAERVNYSKQYEVYDSVHNVANLSDYRYAAECAEIVKRILELEAPISEEVLYNRFANAVGLSRAGSRVQQTVISSLKRIGARRNANFKETKLFFWMNGQGPALEYYRVGGAKPREMDDVPKEEIFVAIKEALTNHGAISVDELKSCVAECFGYKAVRSKVSEAIEDALQYYKSKGDLIVTDDGRIALKGEL